MHRLFIICLIAAGVCFGQVASGDPIVGGTAVVNVGTGFRIADAATTGRYLRGDGTNFVQSSVAAGGAGSCTNQFVRATVDNSTPTCASVVNADVGASAAIDASKLSNAARDVSKAINIFLPTTADTNKIQFDYPQAVTIQEVHCSTDTGTATIQLDERVKTTPNTAGTNVMTASLVCDTDDQSTATFTNAGIAADAPVNLQITATASTPTVVRIHVQARLD